MMSSKQLVDLIHAAIKSTSEATNKLRSAQTCIKHPEDPDDARDPDEQEMIRKFANEAEDSAIKAIDEIRRIIFAASW